MERYAREKAAHRTRAEHEALDQAERERQVRRYEMQCFFAAQRKRFAKSLTRSVNRIHEARWSSNDGDDAQLLISRK